MFVNKQTNIYPTSDIIRQCEHAPQSHSANKTSPLAARNVPCSARAKISEVALNSPAYDAGFEPGCYLVSVNGNPLRDIIDWRWYASDDVIELEYIDLEGDSGSVVLEREFGQDWGFTFEGVIFDNVKVCRNSCSFCFMRQLPANMRPSLSVRDDDFRLSFLCGTFVTMTNITPEDEARIVQQHISPLRVSLHAVTPEVRRKLIGNFESHGMRVITRLLEQGIEMHVQIVLVPGVNDGEELARTISWAYKQPGIVQVGIVPLGYTRHQDIFQHSFNSPYAARNVLKLIAPFQRKAFRERGNAWVFAADEFYRNAYQNTMLEVLPPAEFYGNFDMFEDGVGIIRTFVDDWNKSVESGLAFDLACVLRRHEMQAVIVMGYAMMPFFEQLITMSPLANFLRVLPVENRFFGGNVDVTGLLTSYDVANALAHDDALAHNNKAVQDSVLGQKGAHSYTQLLQNNKTNNTNALKNSSEATSEATNVTLREATNEATSEDTKTQSIVVIPNVVLNAQGFLLDDGTLDDVYAWSGVVVHAVSCNPSGFLREIMHLVEQDAHISCDNNPHVDTHSHT